MVAKSCNMQGHNIGPVAVTLKDWDDSGTGLNHLPTGDFMGISLGDPGGKHSPQGESLGKPSTKKVKRFHIVMFVYSSVSSKS